MGIDDNGTMKHTGIAAQREAELPGRKSTGEDGYTASATDEELDLIEKMARSRGMAGLVRVINRLRKAEAVIAGLKDRAP